MKIEPWIIYRDGKETARASSHMQAKSIVRQLRRMHRNSYFVVRYVGKSISHCTDGGKPIDG